MPVSDLLLEGVLRLQGLHYPRCPAAQPLDLVLQLHDGRAVLLLQQLHHLTEATIRERSRAALVASVRVVLLLLRDRCVQQDDPGAEGRLSHPPGEGQLREPEDHAEHLSNLLIISRVYSMCIINYSVIVVRGLGECFCIALD